jgi:hypothetical protein
MNAHLDIDDLLTDPVSERARAHLDGCAGCRTEAARWETAAGGVLELIAGTPEPELELDVVPAGPVRGGTGRRPRTAFIATAAAAVLVLGGVGYGLSSALIRSGPGTVTAGLTAVSGCAGLEQTDGTLAQLDGTTVIVGASPGQQVRAATSARTSVNVSGLPISDITDGASAMVAGPESNGTLQAKMVILGATGARRINTPDGPPTQGTISDLTGTGFTLVEPDGTQLAVTTSSDTNVTMINAGLGQLRTGAYTMAIGYARPDGTLAAIAILQPPSRNVVFSIRGCTPSSMDHAFTMAFMAAS